MKMMTYLQATCNTHSLRCTGCIYVDSKECRTASWRYHTGRFICENSIAQGDLDRGEYFLLSGRYSPLILYLRIGLKTSASIYQLLTFQLTLCQQTRVSIYFQKKCFKPPVFRLWPFFTVPGQKTSSESLCSLFWNKTRVTFPIFWRIAGLLLSQGHDSLQT